MITTFGLSLLLWLSSSKVAGDAGVQTEGKKRPRWARRFRHPTQVFR